MFAKTHVYHPEHVPATGDYEVTYRGPLRGLPRGRDRIVRPASVAHPRANMATFDDVRAIAMALPEADEIVTWDVDITFRVRKKIIRHGRGGQRSRVDQGDACHPG